MVFIPYASQGKCAFVNLGKKASELTVADVSGFGHLIHFDLTSFLGLGCAGASQEQDGADKGTKYPDSAIVIFVTTSSEFKGGGDVGGPIQ